MLPMISYAEPHTVQQAADILDLFKLIDNENHHQLQPESAYMLNMIQIKTSTDYGVLCEIQLYQINEL